MLETKDGNIRENLMYLKPARNEPELLQQRPHTYEPTQPYRRNCTWQRRSCQGVNLGASFVRLKLTDNGDYTPADWITGLE